MYSPFGVYTFYLAFPFLSIPFPLPPFPPPSLPPSLPSFLPTSLPPFLPTSLPSYLSTSPPPSTLTSTEEIKGIREGSQGVEAAIKKLRDKEARARIEVERVRMRGVCCLFVCARCVGVRVMVPPCTLSDFQ